MIFKLSVPFITLLITSFVSCQKKENSNLITIGRLSNELNEVSGITLIPNEPNIYAINDSGNGNTLLKINPQGKIIATYTIPNATNVDWEDLTYNKKGEIYIGDFGNNHNNRTDLAIYKVSEINNNTLKSSKIQFTLEDQNKFPPKKKNKNYDIEAFTYNKGSFYLFTKNRSSKFDGSTKIYKVKDQPGEQIAKLIDTLTFCNDPNDCFITAAAINNLGNKIALLTYNKIYLIDNFNSDHLFNTKIRKLKLNHFSQKEGITFKNDSVLYIVDEKRNNRNGQLYEYHLRKSPK